jgi:hypothetical protein
MSAWPRVLENLHVFASKAMRCMSLQYYITTQLLLLYFEMELIVVADVTTGKVL